MARSSLAVANAVLDEAQRQGVDVTPMQLQKLLYFLDGWRQEMRGAPMTGGQYEAWQFGPVLPEVYRRFKLAGSAPINFRALNPFSGQAIEEDLSNSEVSLISEIVKIYGRLTGPQMSHLTHRPETPWSKTWSGGLGRNDKISQDLIKEEFAALRRNAAA